MNHHRHDTTRTLQRRSARQQPDEKPYLLGVSGEHAGRLFLLDGRAELVIGRTEDCEIRISLDEMVSRRHARLCLAPGGNWSIEDLESLNGTRVNGRDVSTLLLRRGDWIEVGEASTYKYDSLSDLEKAHRESGLIDGLTELWNRKVFDVRLPEMLRQAAEHSRPLGLLMLDVDHFKTFNDSYGHQAGDHALKEVADAVAGWFSASALEAVCCRYGGEEFAILLPRCTAGTLREIAEGLRTAVAAVDLRHQGEPLKVTASLGGSLFDGLEPTEPEALLKAADDNLYEAKASGRNCWVCPPPD